MFPDNTSRSISISSFWIHRPPTPTPFFFCVCVCVFKRKSLKASRMFNQTKTQKWKEPNLEITKRFSKLQISLPLEWKPTKKASHSPKTPTKHYKAFTQTRKRNLNQCTIPIWVRNSNKYLYMRICLNR